MKWSFQLLLEVYCLQSKIVGFPIIADTFLRNEPVVFDYPFEFSYVVNGNDECCRTRYFERDVKFIKLDNKIHLLVKIENSDLEPLEPLIVDALISRDKLMRS